MRKINSTTDFDKLNYSSSTNISESKAKLDYKKSDTDLDISKFAKTTVFTNSDKAKVTNTFDIDKKRVPNSPKEVRQNDITLRDKQLIYFFVVIVPFYVIPIINGGFTNLFGFLFSSFFAIVIYHIFVKKIFE